jgi:hypothetical protein
MPKADVAQLVARCADNAKVSGSSPDIRIFLLPIFGSQHFMQSF